MTLAEHNPTGIIYHKYAVRYLLELMHEVLSPQEEQLVLLHCGMGTSGRPVPFEALAEVFRLSAAEEAEEIYRRAIARTREALPGSSLENWLLAYQMAYHPGREKPPVLTGRPIPVWTGENPAP